MRTENEEPSRESATPNAELERRSFENWFSGGNPSCKSIERSGEGYRLMGAHQAWTAWKARAAVQVVQNEYICPKCGLRQSLGIQSDCEF